VFLLVRQSFIYGWLVNLNAMWYRVVIIHADACSGTPVELTTSLGTIQSPGYVTSTYSDNSHCQWHITSSPGYVRIRRHWNVTSFLQSLRFSFLFFSFLSLVFSERWNIYISCLCYDVSVRLSVCLWRKCIVVTVHAGKRGGVISRYASHC